MPTASPQQQAFWRGFRAGAPFLIIIGPFGVLFGVLASDAGMSLLETMAFSVLVIAGAAQFTAIQLMEEQAPTLIVVIAALAVNLRMAMYSAALTPHLGQASTAMRAAMAYFLVDQTYAASAMEFENRPQMSISEKIAYFFGVTVPVCPFWYVATWLGATLGTAIPPEFALDFAVPITFIAIVTPMMRTPAHFAAAGMSVAVALGLSWVPYSGGLLVAAAAAMLTGALVETRMERHADRVRRAEGPK